MNEYLIEVSESAQTDLREIVRYIQTDLTSPGTAERFLDDIEKMLEQLAFMPQKFQFARDDYLASKGYRYLSNNKVRQPVGQRAYSNLLFPFKSNAIFSEFFHSSFSNTDNR